MPEADALGVKGVSKHFGGVRAVDSVSFAVRQGERHSLIGPNGAGKTTLFNLVTGALKADAGSVHFFGRDITALSARERALAGMGRSYQISRLFLELTVEENIVLAASGNESLLPHLFTPWRSRREKRDWAAKVAEQVDLAPALQTPVKNLSHGQQRQLEFGMTLAMKAKMILLDEPAAGLSPGERAIIKQLLAELPRSVTVLLIEHDTDLVLDFSDRITVLHQGAVCAGGTPGEIRNNERVQQVYLGALPAPEEMEGADA